jgi:peptide/nickel transport system substrate-binding protein
MLEEVFSGYGTIGNDMFGVFDPDFDHSIPQRVQDIPQAKSLLKAAGHSNLTVELITANVADGVTEEAAVFATQAAAAGVTVKVTQIDVTQFYANYYLKSAFSMDNWGYAPYLVNASQATVAGAPFNETHFDNAEYNSLYAKAFASTDPAVHRDVVHAMQRIDYDSGGLIIPLFNPLIDVLASNVKGDVPNVVGQGGLDGFDLRRFWID